MISFMQILLNDSLFHSCHPFWLLEYARFGKWSLLSRLYYNGSGGFLQEFISKDCASNSHIKTASTQKFACNKTLFGYFFLKRVSTKQNSTRTENIFRNVSYGWAVWKSSTNINLSIWQKYHLKTLGLFGIRTPIQSEENGCFCSNVGQRLIFTKNMLYC